MEAPAVPAMLAEHCLGSRRPRRHRSKKKPALESKAHHPEIEVPMQSASSGQLTQCHPKNKVFINQEAQCLEYKTVTHPLSIDRKRRRQFVKQLTAEPTSQYLDGQAAVHELTYDLPTRNNNQHNRKIADELEASANMSKAAARTHRLPGSGQTKHSVNVKKSSGPTTHLPRSMVPSQLSHSILPLAAGSIFDPQAHIEDPLPYPNPSPSHCVLPYIDPRYQSVSSDTPVSNACNSSAEPTCKSRGLSSKERRFIEKVRAGVVDYRFQSLSHFSLHIDVRPSERVHSTEIQVAHDFKMKIIFQNYLNMVPRICRLHSQSGEGIAFNEVQVLEGTNWTSLQESLANHFPATSADVGIEGMQEWWGSNGKSFNWPELPAELKENVIQYCMCQPFNYGDYFYSLKGLRLLKSRNPGPAEIIGQLGDWGHLLGVSAEIRKLTLQLCFRGGWLYPQGLSIMVNSHRHFEKSIRRLGSYYQIFDCNSVPKATDLKATTLARQYKYFPKIYPELKIYGTFMHGIKKVYLEFDFWSSLHFFKVSVCGFDKYRPEGFMTCEVLERLPQLSSIYFHLPTRDMTKDNPMRYGPRLFDNTKPCPRSLHRLIYEQAAIELAPYDGVHMNMFMDQNEEDRFTDLYAAAKSSLKFTSEELIQLWEDDDGGIPLDMNSTALDDCDRTKSVYERDSRLDGAGNITLTQDCQCIEPCGEAFVHAGKY